MVSVATQVGSSIRRESHCKWRGLRFLHCTKYQSTKFKFYETRACSLFICFVNKQKEIEKVC